MNDPVKENTDDASDSGDDSCCETDDDNGGVGAHVGTGRTREGIAGPFAGLPFGAASLALLARLASTRWNIRSTLSSWGVSKGIIVRHVMGSGSSK